MAGERGCRPGVRIVLCAERGSVAIALDVHLEDGGAVNEAVDRGDGRGGIGENLVSSLQKASWRISSDRRSYRVLISSKSTLVSVRFLVT